MTFTRNRWLRSNLARLGLYDPRAVILSGCVLPARARTAGVRGTEDPAARPGSIRRKRPRACPWSGHLATYNANCKRQRQQSVGRRLCLSRFLCLVSSLRSLLDQSVAFLRPVPALRGIQDGATAREPSEAASLWRRAGGRAKRALYLVRATPPHLPCAFGEEARVTGGATSHDDALLRPSPRRSGFGGDVRSGQASAAAARPAFLSLSFSARARELDSAGVGLRQLQDRTP